MSTTGHLNHLLSKKFIDLTICYILCLDEALVKPITINVWRAGAANLDVRQKVECLRPDEKFLRLMKAIMKTTPPVLIFAERKPDVELIHEYLILKCFDVASIHGGKDQEERMTAIKEFNSGKKDILVATDVASKGLDFPEFRHVINFDMPVDIENYVHRIGRTGGCGKTGLATTFVSRSENALNATNR